MRVPPPNPQRTTAARPRNPGEIATNLVAWWRSDQGLWQDSGGTTPAGQGDPVGRWSDISGNARHATQATAGNRPTLSLDAQGGWPVVFASADDYLATVAVPAMAATDMTIFTVMGRATASVASSYGPVVLVSDAPTSTPFLAILWSPSLGEIIACNARKTDGSVIPVANAALTGPNVSVATLTTGGAVAMWTGATRSGTNTGANHANTVNIGVSPVGRPDAATPNQSLGVAETAYWSRVLTNAEIKSLIAYGKARYGL